MQSELDITTGRLLSEPKEIWGGFARYDTEGPHIYKKDGYYYLLAAEGGTFEHHMLSIARSRNIWGPYESYQLNPVLTADGKEEYVQNTGHGELFQDAQGLWWAVVLGVRLSAKGNFPMSRETFLTPVDWPVGEWPSFKQPKTTMAREESQTLALPMLEYSPAPGLDLLYLRNRIPENYNISFNGSELVVTMLTSTTDLSTSFNTTSFIGKRQRNLGDVFTATLLNSDHFKDKQLRAGIAVYKDQFRFAELAYSYETEEVIHYWLKQDTGVPTKTRNPVTVDDKISFKIEASELRYEFFYSLGNEEWFNVGYVDSSEMSACDFTSPIFGVFSTGEQGIPVEFNSIELKHPTTK
jgi:beta-xylosidase